MILRHINEHLKQHIIREYSEGVIKKLTDKYTKENPQLTPAMIRRYIERHDEIKRNLDPEYKDIMKLSFAELEGVVDSYRSKKDKKAMGGLEDKNARRSDPNLLLDKNGVVLFASPDFKSCRKYGEGANYCVKQPDMFQKYRREKGGGTAYFAFNEKLSPEDVHYRVVIHAFMDGTFLLTDNFNNHQNEVTLNSEDELISRLESKGNWQDASMLRGHLEAVPLSIRDLYPDIKFENGKYVVDGDVNLSGMNLTELPKYWEAV